MTEILKTLSHHLNVYAAYATVHNPCQVLSFIPIAPSTLQVMRLPCVLESRSDNVHWSVHTITKSCCFVWWFVHGL